MADTLMRLSSVHFTYTFPHNQICPSLEKKTVPMSNCLSPTIYIIMSFKRIKKKTENSEWQSLWKERLIGGTTGAKPPFKPFSLRQTVTDGRRKRPIRSTNIMYFLQKKMLHEIIQTTGCMCVMRACVRVCVH